MKLRLLDRYLAREVFRFFAFSVGLFTTILVAMQELQPLTSMVVEHGVPISTATRIFLLSLPYFMALAFPMAMLLSALLALGELSGNAETISMLAAGVSYYRMALPIAVMGVLVSLIAISFSELVAPAATREKNRLYDLAISAGVPSNRPFVYTQMDKGRMLFVLVATNYDGETKKLVNPTLFYYSEDGKPSAVEYGQQGMWRGGTEWTLQNGYFREITDQPNGAERFLRLDKQEVSLGVSLQQLLAANQDPNALTFRELDARIKQKRREGRAVGDINPDLVILYSKGAIPFASLVFAMIGFPLGIKRQRSGSTTGFAISIGIIFVYYLVYQYASILGNNGAVSPLLSAWIPDLLGLVIAAFLLRRLSL